MTTLIIFGLADGVSPIISYNYGAKFHKRVKVILKNSFVISMIIGIVSYLMVYFFGDSMVSMFADGNMELVELTYQGSKLYAIVFVIFGINILASAYFTAIGKAFPSAIISICRGIVFILIGVMILPRIMGVTGVWLVAPFAELLTLFVLWIFFKKDL